KSSNDTLAPSRAWRRTIWSLTMTPTCSEFTSTLCGAPSIDIALVSAICAARLTEVGALSAPGAFAPILSTLMMRPHFRPFICGIRMRQKRICANSLRSRSDCHCASVIVSDGPRVDCPALLTKMSTLPNSLLHCAQAASIGPAFETSHEIASTLPLASFWISALALLRAPWSRARIATSAPERANSWAIARPSPLLPPVTIALLPARLTSMTLLRVWMALVCRQPVDLVHVFGGRHEFGGRDIGRDLLRRGRAGDDAGDPRPPQQPAEGQLQQAAPAPLAKPGERFELLPVRVGQRALGDTRGRRQPRAFRHRRVAPVLAGQQPVEQRRERDQPQPVLRDHRRQRPVEIALDQIVALLARDKGVEVEVPRRPLRLDHLPREERRAADVAHLALAHEIVERAQRLLDRRPRVFDMLLVKVDVVGAEPPQAVLDRAHDVAPRGALARRHRPRELGRQHDLAASPGERPAEIFLRRPGGAVGVRRVVKGDAEIERLVHHLARRGGIVAPAEIFEADPDHRDDQPRPPQIALFQTALPDRPPPV